MNTPQQRLNLEITREKVSRLQQSPGHCVASMNYCGFETNTAWHGKLLEIGNSISQFVSYKDETVQDELLL